jgi:glutaredoxin
MKKNILYSVNLILTLFLLNFFSAQNCSAEEVKSENPDSHESQIEGNLKMGERLFFGLIITEDNTINCASCHNTTVVDTFNWNPSALEIAISTQYMDSASFANSLLNPVTTRISEAHKNIKLSAEQILDIRYYLDTFRTEGLKKPKILVTKLVFFIFLILLLMAAFIDLSFTKKIKFKPVHILVILFALTFIFKIIVHDAIGLGRTKDYAPLQPIKFSHKVHATDNKIDCMYCHHTAETAKSAGIPSTNVCLNCHELVREGTNSGRFEINKILVNIENNHSTEWIRIHKLPDHVFFNHAQHVGVGKLDCKECHGLVKEDHLAKQYSDLSMGWCLDCHRTKNVDFLGNEYYGKTFEEFHKQFEENPLDSATVAELGGENCMKCHY